MTPVAYRKLTFGCHEIVEYYWQGKKLVYFDHVLTKKTFEEECYGLWFSQEMTNTFKRIFNKKTSI